MRADFLGVGDTGRVLLRAERTDKLLARSVRESESVISNTDAEWSPDPLALERVAAKVLARFGVTNGVLDFFTFGLFEDTFGLFRDTFGVFGDFLGLDFFCFGVFLTGLGFVTTNDGCFGLRFDFGVCPVISIIAACFV